MALTPASRLGPYEVIGPLGAGGMGEIYKARDTRLDRIVAIKVLPADVAQDVERRNRLEREARAIASLNHPHICTLHDVGTQDGIDFLVMEYLEGETLAERLERGALPVDQALEISIPIANALDKAHRAGIVHRDLKPGNIMLTKSGPKLLDFGLAKLRMKVMDSEADSPTRDRTAPGSLLGTLSYMAPEQLDGKEADARADLWALGAVIHEMVTGRRAFEGGSPASLIAAILEHEPPTLSHPLLNRVVRKCLAKDPDARWQSAEDVGELLRWAREIEPESKTSSSWLRRWERAVWALAAAVLVGLLFFLRNEPVEVAETRLSIVTPPTSDPNSMTISPDGRQIVFLAESEEKSMLWLRRLDAVDAQPVPSTEGASFPFWSPDSQSVAFFADGKLKRIDLEGGPARVLADALAGRGGAWNGEGTIVFAPSPNKILNRVSDHGGETAEVARAEGQPRFPQFFPDDRHFLFYVRAGAEDRGVYLGSLESPERRRLLDADSAAVLGPSDHLFFVREGTLLAQRFDLRRLELLGEPASVARGVVMDRLLGRAALSASPTVLAYRTGTAGQRQMVWFDRSGKPTGTVGDPDPTLGNPEISPDGRRIAFDRTVGANTDVYLLETERGALSRFTADEGEDGLSTWSPDGTRLAFTSYRKGFACMYQKLLSGGEEEELLPESSDPSVALDWSRDGRFLLFRNKGDLWVLPLEGDRKPFPFVATPFEERNGQFAPDGRFVAYQSNETGRVEVYLQPFPGPGEKTPVSIDGGAQPRWRPDGRELYYIALDGSLIAVPVTSKADPNSLELGAPVESFSTRIAGGAMPNINYKQQYDVFPDGKRFLINVTTEETVTDPITVVLNWKPPVKP